MKTTASIPANSLEILNFESYQRVANEDQPSILLHGLAHALFHSMTAAEQFDIEQTFRIWFNILDDHLVYVEIPTAESKYREVMSTGKYDNVMNYFGESVAHYGKKNAQTYFAEARFQIDCESA